MQLHNASDIEAGYTIGLQKNDRHCIVLVAKATYSMPTEDNEPANLKDKEDQVVIYESDEFTEESITSAPLYENDYAPNKVKCDIVLNGSAYSFPYEDTDSKVVQLKILDSNNEPMMDKSFRVIAPHTFSQGLFGARAQQVEPFSKQCISYNTAYGGNDFNPKKSTEEEDVYTSFVKNPSGIGYYPHQSKSEVQGKPLAQTESINESTGRTDNTKYTPEAYGVIGRDWYPRHTFGGTYDEKWDKYQKPFLPKDFNELYYQCVPPNQQTSYLQGGELVYLKGLLPNREELTFKIPKLDVPMEVIRSNGKRELLKPVIDTLTIEPDKGYFTLVYRASIELKRSIHEIDMLIVGKPNELWEKKRLYGECYEEETETDENN